MNVHKMLKQAYKIGTYILALESVQTELTSRFTDLAVDVLREMQFFTPRYLLSDQSDIYKADIKKLCNFYEMDPADVASELAEFRPVYRKLHTLICVDDLLFDTRKSIKSSENDHDGQSENKQDDDNVEPVVNDAESNCIDSLRWTDQSFIKPFRALQELSGFHALNVIYKILVSLAITSSSAERAMSRVRLIKNRLRTTMLDDWFSSLMVLASEKDVLERIAINRIIDNFATVSTPLQKLLM